MTPVQYVFLVDVFTPDTMPMARLAEYLAALAKLIGHSDHTHFVALEKGSAKVVHKVDAIDAPKVEQRLREVATGGGTKDARKGFEILDDLLAADNAVGQLLTGTGAVIIPFPGRTRPRPLEFPSFWQKGSIDGQLVSIGGRDTSAHAILQDGQVIYAGVTMKRDVARELAPLLYGPKLRIHGRGKWERHPDGVWKLLEFRVEAYEQLDDSPLGTVLTDLRGIRGNGLMSEGAYQEVLALRLDDGEVH